MPNRQYEQGRRFEWKVQADLEDEGYVTMRAAGSKGTGKVDIVACLPVELWPGVRVPDEPTPGHLWIQCKRTGDIGPGEWNRVFTVAGWAGAVPILAMNGPGGRGVVYERMTGPRIPGTRRVSEAWPGELYNVRVRRTLVG